ncbi:hypothetical protein [Methylobacter marinus]|uniref:hypothetical protein n=1 Tax=Methylobacter marinus TaxID=34058 RepID=UPI00037D5365|nr:hypothetical protein [Methylobacter marinus]
MSTAIAISPMENTANIQEYAHEYGENKYRYGKTGTDFLSTKEPEIRPCSPKFLTPVLDLNRPREDIKQRWSGKVISATDQELTVRLEDLTNRDNPDELIVLSRDEIDDKDQSLVKPGALFYWYIGYRQGFKYSKERISIIRFRRLPSWTTKEIQESEKLAEEYANFFLTD